MIDSLESIPTAERLCKNRAKFFFTAIENKAKAFRSKRRCFMYKQQEVNMSKKERKQVRRQLAVEYSAIKYFSANEILRRYHAALFVYHKKQLTRGY